MTTPCNPPPAPLAVGDVIETVEDLERLPEGTLLFSTQLHAYWMEKEGHFVAIGSDRWLVADEAASYGPFTIRWLPEPEADLNMAHIAAFDPPTVLALIDEVERLRETLATVKAITDGTPECDKYDDKSPVTCGWKFDLQRIKEVVK